MPQFFVPWTNNALALTTSARRVDFVYRNFPKSFTADRIIVCAQTVTGAQPTYRVSLQSLTSGYPSGTVLGGTTAKCDTTFTVGMNTCMLDTPYAITAGDQLAVSVQYLSGTIGASNSSTILHYTAPTTLIDRYGMSITSGSYSTSRLRVKAIPLITIASSTDMVGIQVNSGTGSTLTLSSKKKIAFEWVCPVRFNGWYLDGLMSSGQLAIAMAYTNNETNKVRGVIWDSAYSVLAATNNLDYSGMIYVPRLLISPLKLVAGTKYLIGFEGISGSLNITSFTAHTVVDDTDIENCTGINTDTAIVPGTVIHSHNGTSWTKHTGFNSFTTSNAINGLLLRQYSAVPVSLNSGFQN